MDYQKNQQKNYKKIQICLKYQKFRKIVLYTMRLKRKELLYMKSKDRIIIQKIINYIEDIEKYIYKLDAKQFLDDKKTITACAFTVSQIGELAKEITEETQNKYEEIPWKSIKGMRNRIVHDYENVDLSVLWGTVKNSLPELKENLKNVLLNEIDEIF